MATAPARPRALAKVRLRRPGPAATTAIVLTLLTAASAFARTRELSAAYWIDEGLSWGISSHHFFSIPHVLRQDRSEERRVGKECRSGRSAYRLRETR